MRRFLDYYRQFDPLTPEEISRELRAQRDASREVAARPELDLSGAAWHEPPHPEIVNAATFALRRAVNAYPDAGPLRAALAAAHGVEPARVVIGHGAGELLRAALRTLCAGGEVALEWPGWLSLPGLIAEAGATPVPLGSAGRLDAARRASPPGAAGDAPPHQAGAGPAGPPPGAGARGAGSPRRRVTVLARPADPTGAVVPLADVRALAAALGEHEWLVLDEALAGFLPDAEDALVEHPRVLHVRSFSKAHAMAGFRIGYAVVPEGLPPARLAPVLGVGAAALAGALWATENGGELVRRRRARVATERQRLAAALEGTGVELAPGHGPYAWLTQRPPLAERLAAHRVFAAPGAAWGDDACVRVTLRDAESTERLAAALRELS